MFLNLVLYNIYSIYKHVIIYKYKIIIKVCKKVFIKYAIVNF